MQAGDLEVLKDIPGYKIILKAVLKSQIQQLFYSGQQIIKGKLIAELENSSEKGLTWHEKVEQLADHTGEESVILTASVSDGSLSHLGSESGKDFLQDHDDIKSQFLGFCLKRHHKQKQQEQQQESNFETNGRLRNTSSTGTYLSGRLKHRITPASPTIPFNSQFSSQDVHPVSLTRNSQRNPLGTNVRHKPYLINRPTKASKHLQPSKTTNHPNETNDVGQIRLNPNEVIKVEAVEEDDESQSDAKSDKSEASNQSGTRNSHASQIKVPFETSISSTPSSFTIQNSTEEEQGLEFAKTVLSETGNKVSKSPIPNIKSVNSGLDVESTDQSEVNTDLGLSEFDGSKRDMGIINPDATVKVEPISEAEMDLEIIGVEPGQMAERDGDWMQPVQTGMGFGGSDSGVSQGNSAEGDEQYEFDTQRQESVFSTYIEGDIETSPENDTTKSRSCAVCCKSFRSGSSLAMHMRIHTGEKPYDCGTCGKQFNQKGNLKAHMRSHDTRQKTHGTQTFVYVLPEHRVKRRGKQIRTQRPCPVCAKLFPSGSSLEIHLRTHTGEKPFSCDVCGKTFSQKGNLIKHTGSHYKRAFKI